MSATVFAALTIAALLINEFVFAAYALFIMTGMMVEFFRMTMEGKYRFAQWTAIVTAFVFFILIFANNAFGMPVRFVSLAIVPLLAMLCSALFIRSKADFTDYAFLCAALLYIALPLSLSTSVVLRDGVFNGKVILSFFIIIWCSDAGAYLVGMGFGQKPGSRKLCPEISPKKSWIGFWGGLLFASLASFVLTKTGLLQINWIHSIILGLVMGLTGVAGDLFESMWKRHYGLKDSGNLIPGHGGLLDRFDSTLFAMPAGAMYLAIFNLL